MGNPNQRLRLPPIVLLVPEGQAGNGRLMTWTQACHVAVSGIGEELARHDNEGITLIRYAGQRDN